MKIVHISDTHDLHREMPVLPSGDILVHTGDFSIAGTDNEAYDFLDWFCDQPFRHTIFIAGNHDFSFYGASGVEGLPENIHYLSNNGVMIDGLRFYGVPLFIQDLVTGDYDNMLRAIPADTDILLTHQSPKENVLLFSRIKQTKIRVSLFGHTHESYNLWQENGVIFSNAAIVDNNYQIAHNPQIINILV